MTCCRLEGLTWLSTIVGDGRSRHEAATHKNTIGIRHSGMATTLMWFSNEFYNNLLLGNNF